MALLSTQQITAAGITPTYTAVSASDTVTADTDLFIHIKNGGAGTDTVTLVDSGRTPGGSPATNPTISIPAGSERLVSLPKAFVNSSTGYVTLTHSVATSVTAAVLRNG